MSDPRPMVLECSGLSKIYREGAALGEALGQAQGPIHTNN